jgi:hypothetical protein
MPLTVQMHAVHAASVWSQEALLTSLPAGDLLVTVPERLLISTSSARSSPELACRLEAAGPLTDLQVGQSIFGGA